jgi:hypothetical protein
MVTASTIAVMQEILDLLCRSICHPAVTREKSKGTPLGIRIVEMVRKEI